MTQQFKFTIPVPAPIHMGLVADARDWDDVDLIIWFFPCTNWNSWGIDQHVDAHVLEEFPRHLAWTDEVLKKTNIPPVMLMGNVDTFYIKDFCLPWMCTPVAITSDGFVDQGCQEGPQDPESCGPSYIRVCSKHSCWEEFDEWTTGLL